MATIPPSAPPPAPSSGPPPKVDPRDEAFMREVDEAYRKDELKIFFRTYGRWLLLGAALALAALGGWFWWKAEQTRQAEAMSLQFTAALTKVESGATTEAVTALQAIGASDNASYRSLAAMAEAGIALSGGDDAKAAGHLRRVAADPAVAAPLRDAATLKLLRLEFDKLPPAEILKRTEPFVAGDSPWFPIAGEMAALAHVKAGATDKAGPLFYRIAADERTPTSIRARAEQMAAALGQDVTKIAEERAKAREAEAGATPASADAVDEGQKAG